MKSCKEKKIMHVKANPISWTNILLYFATFLLHYKHVMCLTLDKTLGIKNWF